ITDDSVPYGIRVPQGGRLPTPYQVLSGQHGILHAAVLGRRDWFVRNPYDPTDHWGEDYRLWVRATLKRDLSVGFIREPLYFYREEGSANARKMLTGQRMRREVIRANGREMAGLARTGALLGKSLLKSLAIGCAAATGSIKQIVRLRSPMVEQDRLRAVQEQIAGVSSVSIPLVACRE